MTKSIEGGVTVYRFDPVGESVPAAFEEEAACIDADHKGRNYRIYVGDTLMYER